MRAMLPLMLPLMSEGLRTTAGRLLLSAGLLVSGLFVLQVSGSQTAVIEQSKRP
jgi:hypothetical protein